MCPVSRCRRGLRRDPSGSALPTLPQSVSRGPGFRGFTGSRLLRPVRLLAPLDGSDRVSPATGGFYIQASGGLVARPAAGYDYNSLWTPLLAGLSPAGMAASLAAPDPGVSADPARSLALHRPKVLFVMLGQRAAPDRDAVITALKPDHSPVRDATAAADADDQVAVRRPEGIAGPVNIALAGDLQQAGRRGMGRPREGAGHEGGRDDARCPHGTSAAYARD